MSAVLEARGLGRTLLEAAAPVVLVADASFTIEAGSFTVITGPSGCGKSSMLYLLGLLDRPTGGTVLIGDRDMSPLDGDERARVRLENFGFIFQFHFLLPELSAVENVAVPIRRLGRLRAEAALERAGQLMEMLGLSGKEKNLPGAMSGGERQRVAIARALANDPRLILADEPTGSLDSKNSQIVIDNLLSLAHQGDRAVVCVTHDPGIAERADHRIQMMDGRVVRID
jgi:lipoprotein-releasing system ATP-binding protein